jgi:hypothetical protein
VTGTAPQVFISYSHDTAAHQARVLDLADRLRADGIDTEIDQYNDAPAEGWPLWCERQIEAADVVLMVCTETYHRRVRGEEAPGKGLGVVWEAAIIRQLIYDAGTVSSKFVPVLFSDDASEHIPTPIKGWSRYVVDSEDGYESLYRRLSGQPRLPRPELGTIRTRPARERRWAEGTREALASSARAQPLHLRRSAGSTDKGAMRPLWRFLRQENNRQFLGWLGGGLIAVVAGAWAVFVYLFPAGPSGVSDPTPRVESHGGVAAGRDINAGDITIDQPRKDGSSP